MAVSTSALVTSLCPARSAQKAASATRSPDHVEQFEDEEAAVRPVERSRLDLAEVGHHRAERSAVFDAADEVVRSRIALDDGSPSSSWRLIAQRTREALAVKRSQGVRLGRPPTLDAKTVARIRRERKRGKTLAAIAEGLTADRVPTAHGCRLHAARSAALAGSK